MKTKIISLITAAISFLLGACEQESTEINNDQELYRITKITESRELSANTCGYNMIIYFDYEDNQLMSINKYKQDLDGNIEFYQKFSIEHNGNIATLTRYYNDEPNMTKEYKFSGDRAVECTTDYLNSSHGYREVYEYENDNIISHKSYDEENTLTSEYILSYKNDLLIGLKWYNYDLDIPLTDETLFTYNSNGLLESETYVWYWDNIPKESILEKSKDVYSYPGNGKVIITDYSYDKTQKEWIQRDYYDSKEYDENGYLIKEVWNVTSEHSSSTIYEYEKGTGNGALYYYNFEDIMYPFLSILPYDQPHNIRK